jgi:hypothetical protein
VSAFSTFSSVLCRAIEVLEWYNVVSFCQAMPICHQCGKDNPNQAFCGDCGSALALKDYISEKIQEQISARDSSIAETDSAIKVFERVLGWVKTVAWIVAIPIAIVGALGIWKVSDFWSAVNGAQRSVTDLSTTAKDQMQSAAQKASFEVQGNGQPVQASHGNEPDRGEERVSVAS